MATLHCTTQIEDDGSLTISRETLSALGLRPGDMLEVSLERVAEQEGEDDGVIADSQSLADFLGDFIGAVEGNGESSCNAGEQFTDYLEQKRRDRHL